ncbi:unnamed protein product, partial [Laminaria digitata]
GTPSPAPPQDTDNRLLSRQPPGDDLPICCFKCRPLDVLPRSELELISPKNKGIVWWNLSSKAVRTAVLQEIMLEKGDNTFTLPHLHKKAAERHGAPIAAAMPASDEAWRVAH